MTQENHQNKYSSQQKQDIFLSLFISNQKMLSGYINLIVPNKADADDIMQDVASILWRKFDKFEIGTNFLAWGKQIARFRIMKYRAAKKLAFQFSDETLKAIEDNSYKATDHLDDRIRALQGCMNKLTDRDKQVIKLRYEDGHKVRDMADKLGRSADGLYHSISRIYKTLHVCIKQTLILWEGQDG